MLEQTGRATRRIIDGVLGITHNRDKARELSDHQRERGERLMRQMVTGGLAVGGSVGLAAALNNYLRTLKQEAELEDESRLNDGTLYVAGGQSKEASVSPWLAPGLGMTGGVLAAGGAYALTQAVYSYLQKKRLQQLLDEAQGETLGTVEEEISKSSAVREKMNFYDLLTAFPVAVPLLAALASGGLTYAALDKAFPVIKRPESKHPKRVRQVSTAGGGGEPADEDEPEKRAGLTSAYDPEEESGQEFLLLMTDALAMEKGASISITSDLLNRVAGEGIRGVSSTLAEGGLLGLVESLKGASDLPASLPDKARAAALICKTAAADTLVAVAAAEYQDLMPGLCTIVADQGQRCMEKLAGLGPILNGMMFRPLLLEKSAYAQGSVAEDDLMVALLNRERGAEDGTDFLDSDASGPMADDLEDGSLEAGADMSEVGIVDPVDEFMSMGEEETPRMGEEEDEDEDEDEYGGLLG
jgi:hypothetical protein